MPLVICIGERGSDRTLLPQSTQKLETSNETNYADAGPANMLWDVIRQVDDRKPAVAESDVEMGHRRVGDEKAPEGAYKYQ
jgi:hypothetical protein